MNKILDILNAPWAIQTDKLAEIQRIYAMRLRGEKVDIKAVEAACGIKLENSQPSYSVIDGVAVLEVTGILGKRMNMFMEISGGCSMQMLGNELKKAAADNDVHSIIQVMDTPGGTVAGTQTYADIVREVSKQKPVYTLADSLMASGGYWVGSAAGPGRVFITDDTTAVGSIGVVAAHLDVSKAEEMEGYKTTEIYAGKYKRITSQYEPLSDAGRQYIQDDVDYLYSIFVGAVRKNRGVSENTVLKDMADGRVFIGQQAIDAGLVDGIFTLEGLIAEINGEGADAFTASKLSKGAKTMSITMKSILADAPELAEALRAEGHAKGKEEGLVTGKAEGLTEGASAEQKRIQDVEGQSLSGHEDLIATLKADGKTTGPEAAVAVMAAEKELRKKNGTDQAADAAGASAPFAAAESDESGSQPDATGSVEDRAKAAWDGDINLRAEFSDNFKTYLAYAKAEENGSVRIQGKK